MASGVGSSSGATAPHTAAQPPHSTMTHFFHPHELHDGRAVICTACRLQSSGVMYTCLSCTSFALHQSCAELPRHVTHPSHAGCVLSLVETASYPGGVFSCDGCKRQGDGWGYHCARCEYDLHVTCACRQLRIRVPAHSSCDLHLVFGNPYRESNGFSCDVCRKIGTRQWLYRCAACEFDVHLDCAAANSRGTNVVGNPFSSPNRPALQNHHSFPATAERSLMNFGGNSFSSPSPAATRLPELVRIGSGGRGYSELVHQFPGRVAGSGVRPVNIPGNSGGGNVGSLK